MKQDCFDEIITTSELSPSHVALLKSIVLDGTSIEHASKVHAYSISRIYQIRRKFYKLYEGIKAKRYMQKVLKSEGATQSLYLRLLSCSKKHTHETHNV